MTGRLPQAAARLLRAELKRAIDAIDDDASPRGVRIHDVRTALKRARALLRLVRSLLGQRGRRERQRLAAIARRFSVLRDAEVVVETIDRLTPMMGRPSRVLSELRVRAAARWRALERRAETTEDLREAGQALGLARRHVQRLFGHARGHGRRDVVDGFAHEYRKARRAMKDAYRLNTPLAFHVWRKSVKTHAYHVKALTDAGAQEMAHRRDSLDGLGSLLGEIHDLTAFEVIFRAQRPGFATARDHQRVLAIIGERQRDIHRKVKRLGKRLFAERASTICRRIGPRPL